MKNLYFILTSFFFALGGRALVAEQPNIIFILADDSGIADFGCYGHPLARTPNIDTLARDGIRFTQCYATGVTCCPSRTGFMTSRWPASFAIYPANGGFGERVTITELLRKAGYATGHFGKWHIGPEEKAQAGTYGIQVVGSAEGKAKRENTRGRDAPIYDQAIRFVEQHRDEPFYVNVWSHISHHAINPPKRYVDQLADLIVDESRFSAPMQKKFAACRAAGGNVDEHMRRYLADIYSMDEDIGRLLKRIDELGLREKTIVVFSSDQGPASIDENADASRRDAMGYTGIFRGGKHGTEEGGIRIPFIVRWPGRIPMGRVDSASVLSGADWLPTVCSIAGIPIQSTDFEGEDVSLAWLGQSAHSRSKPLFWRTSSPGSTAAIREGPWKLFYPVRRNGGELALYNIETDPGESRNLASQHPELVKKLGGKVAEWVATLPKEYVKANDKEDKR